MIYQNKSSFEYLTALHQEGGNFFSTFIKKQLDQRE